MSSVQGIALRATSHQLNQLLYIVDNCDKYRDWEWLNRWLDGWWQEPTEFTPEVVVEFYANDAYWVAVKSGDTPTLEKIRRALVGTY